jgi:hypothetical protein
MIATLGYYITKLEKETLVRRNISLNGNLEMKCG